MSYNGKRGKTMVSSTSTSRGSKDDVYSYMWMEEMIRETLPSRF